MKHIFAVQEETELLAYQSFLAAHKGSLEQYLDFLREQYAVTELPRAVVWTNAEAATRLLGDIPIPAYTNEFRTVFCPALETWKAIYLRQLDHIRSDEARNYYETRLSENHVLQILGHEFVHHSALFLDEFDAGYESGIWFEEGMCEYISRKYFLTDAEFDEEARINERLVELLRKQYGNHSLENFGAATYQGDYASIFFEYWRSFLAVQNIVKQFAGDIQAVFREYHLWGRSNSGKSLSMWFSQEK